jgi:hypothetical protein
VAPGQRRAAAAAAAASASSPASPALGGGGLLAINVGGAATPGGGFAEVLEQLCHCCRPDHANPAGSSVPALQRVDVLLDDAFASSAGDDDEGDADDGDASAAAQQQGTANAVIVGWAGAAAAAAPATATSRPSAASSSVVGSRKLLTACKIVFGLARRTATTLAVERRWDRYCHGLCSVGCTHLCNHNKYGSVQQYTPRL